MKKSIGPRLSIRDHQRVIREVGCKAVHRWVEVTVRSAQGYLFQEVVNFKVDAVVCVPPALDLALSSIHAVKDSLGWDIMFLNSKVKGKIMKAARKASRVRLGIPPKVGDLG